VRVLRLQFIDDIKDIRGQAFNSWKIFYQGGIQLENRLYVPKISNRLIDEKSPIHPFNKAGNITGSLSILSMSDPYKTRQ